MARGRKKIEPKKPKIIPKFNTAYCDQFFTPALSCIAKSDYRPSHCNFDGNGVNRVVTPENHGIARVRHPIDAQII